MCLQTQMVRFVLTLIKENNVDTLTSGLNSVIFIDESFMPKSPVPIEELCYRFWLLTAGPCTFKAKGVSASCIYTFLCGGNKEYEN